MAKQRAKGSNYGLPDPTLVSELPSIWLCGTIPGRGEVEWGYLVSAWTYSQRIYIRDGEVYPLSIKVSPLYKGKEVPLVLCEEHSTWGCVWGDSGVVFAPSPEIWEEVAHCGECYAQTVAQSPTAVRRRPGWPFRVEEIHAEGRGQ